MKTTRGRYGVAGHFPVGCALLGALACASWPARADDSQSSAPPHLADNQHFTIDPVVDGVFIVGGVGFSEILSLILSTGEIRPTVPGSSSALLGIDRLAVTQTIDPHAGTYSNIGLYAAYGFAVLDPIMSGWRDGSRALLVDGILYAESISLTWTFTDATKIAVRRPRPIDYINCSGSNAGSCSSTDLQLSFFSGHAADLGAITGTATYLAFVRSPARSPRPWITLGVGTALTAFVSYERVRAGEHFPTDVIVGSMAGAAIGVLVPHIHRRPHFHGNEYEAPPIWIGFQPTAGGSGAVTVGGLF